MLRIGAYELSSNLILAPMAGVTDRPFRSLCRQFGAGLAVSEMITSDTSLWGSRKSLRRLNHKGEMGPISVQIVGSDPAEMAEAARINVHNGAQIIDINMGCPAKKVCKVLAGSALLKDETLVENILKAVVKAVPVPVTLKIRTGWDKQHRNGVRISQIAEQAGIQLLSVHGRTRACAYKGEAEYNTIKNIKQAVSIPIVANGDITCAKKAEEVLSYTGCDAIMIGRAAQGKPWIFGEINHFLSTGEALAPPTSAQIADIVLQHVRSLHAFYGDTHGVRIARKHIAWYSKTIPACNSFKQMVNRLDDAQQQLHAIQVFFDQQQNKGYAA